MAINKEQLIQFTQKLVQHETLSGDERPAVDLVDNEMRQLGFDYVFVDAYGTVIGIIQGKDSGPTLLFDGHLDTVGVAPGITWKHDPFGAEIADGRMYGRGTSDMKGAVAAMIYAAAAVDRSKLAGRIIISASVMEEVMEGLALEAVMDETKPDLVVIGESTDLNIAHGGRGRAELHLESIGRPSHSSAPHLGKNAVHMMLPAIQAIEQMDLPTDPLIGDGVQALTDIISDPYPGHSVIPSRCRVTYDRRVIPGETANSVITELKAMRELSGINVTIPEAEYITYTGVTMRSYKFFPAWKLPVDHMFVEAALAGLRSAGLEPGLRAYQFCTNAAYSAGVARVPTIGFGPSAEGMAHTVDEYVELVDLEATAKGYLGIIESVCKGH
jgi:putative selenium metabolism hydrolase